MPDRELTDKEIKQLQKNRLSTASFHALKPVFTEGTRPTLYDFYFASLKALHAQNEFRVMELLKEIAELKEAAWPITLFTKRLADGPLDLMKKRGRRK